MKKLRHLAFALMVAAAALLALPVGAFACTSLFVGSQLTSDGSTYYGRSEDYGQRYRKVFGVEEAKDHDQTETYNNDPEGGSFSRPYPLHTLRFTYLRDASDSWGGCPLAYAEAGQNEKGVSMSATVTTDYNSEAKAADPLLDTGLTEFNLGSIILGESTSAREGCQLIGKIIDKYGAGECLQFTIADENETWLFASVSGHQWVAFKLSDDKVQADPNMGNLPVELDFDSPNVLASAGLISTAADHGFDTWFDANKTNFDVFTSYGETDSGTGQYTRYVQAASYLNPLFAATLTITKDANGAAKAVAGSKLVFDSNKKDWTTLEMLQFLSTRGEGTDFDATKNTKLYSVGNSRQAECHIFQTRQGLPKVLSTLQWTAMSCAKYSVYLPSYTALITDTAPVYADGPVDHENEDPLTTAVPGSIFYTFADINALCDKNPDAYGANVSKYFENMNKDIIAQQKIVDARMKDIYQNDPAQAQKKATEIASKLATEVNTKGEKLLAELKAYIKVGDTSKPFVPSQMNADGTNKDKVTYAAYLVDPAFTAQPKSATYEQGAKAAPLTVAATIDDGTGVLFYQWFEKGANGTDKVVGSGTSYTPSTETVGTKTYYAKVSDTAGDAVQSDAATITVKAKAQPPAPKPDANKPTTISAKGGDSSSPTTSDNTTVLWLLGILMLGAACTGFVAFRKRAYHH